MGEQTISWFQFGQFILGIIPVLVLYQLQRARTEQVAWRKEMREELGMVKGLTTEVRMELGRIDERTEAHAAQDLRQFETMLEDIRVLQRSHYRPSNR